MPALLPNEIKRKAQLVSEQEAERLLWVLEEILARLVIIGNICSSSLLLRLNEETMSDVTESLSALHYLGFRLFEDQFRKVICSVLLFLWEKDYPSFWLSLWKLRIVFKQNEFFLLDDFTSKKEFLLWKVESESEVAQSCLTLCDPMDCSLPSSSVHGIFQAIVLEWIAISFSSSGRLIGRFSKTSVSLTLCPQMGVFLPFG